MIELIAQIQPYHYCRRTWMSSASTIIIISLWTPSPPTPTPTKNQGAQLEFTRHYLEAPRPLRNPSWNLLEIIILSERRLLLEAVAPFVVLLQSRNLLDVAGAAQVIRYFFQPYSLDFLYIVTKRGRCSGIEEFSLPTGFRALLLFLINFWL